MRMFGAVARNRTPSATERSPGILARTPSTASIGGILGSVNTLHIATEYRIASVA
jgi:hypothetical protein